MQLWVRCPVLVKYEQELLRPAQREDRDEAPPSPGHHLVHRGGEPALPVLPLLVDVDAVGGLHDEDVGPHRGQLGRHQVTVLLAGEVARVEDAHAGDLHHEHGCAQDVPGVVRPELDTAHLALLVEVDGLDLVHAGLQVLLSVEHLLGGDVADLDEVGEEPAVDGLGGVGHEALAAERGLLQEPGQGAGVVQVEVGDQQQVDLVRLDHVHEGERVHAVEAGVDAAVQQDLLLLELEDVAGAADLRRDTVKG